MSLSLRILILGDLGPTGFGTVTADLGKALLALGHDVRFVSQNELDKELPEPFTSRTFRVDPSILDPDKLAAFGEDSLSLTTKGMAGILDGTLWWDKWQAERVILLGDYTATAMMVLADQVTIDAFRAVPTFHYVPIEGVDLPPSWGYLWSVIQPVAMSEFGADQIGRVTGTRPPFVYHGVDTDVFHPAAPNRLIRLNDRKIRDKEGAKRYFGGSPKGRWLFRCDRNMPRKRYGSMLRALAPVMATRPDVFMVIHCRARDQGGSIRDLISKYHPNLQKRIILTGLVEEWGSVPRDLLVALYNAADIYVSTSAEGFGLTIAEAMACGVPVVGMAYSAVPEVIGPGGLTAPVNHLVDNDYDHAWAAVDEKVFGEQVALLLDDEALRLDMGRKARAHVLATFQWSHKASQFAELMA